MVEIRVAIAGDGVCGSLLSFFLPGSEVYDVKEEGEIGQDCAWGIREEEFRRIYGRVGLNPSDYLQVRLDEIICPVFSSRDSITFDKHRFLRDVRKKSDADFTLGKKFPLGDIGKYDLVIDATGRRALFEDSAGYVVPCYQLEVEGEGFPDDPFIDLRKEVGYLWSFPQGNGRYRIGCGLLIGSPKEPVEEFLEDKDYTVVANRSGSVRLSSPERENAYPHIDGVPIVAVGESIGTVTPLTGEGIAPSARSAEILLECLEDVQKYQEREREEFAWIESQQRLIESLESGSRLSQLIRLLKVENPEYLSVEISKLKVVTGYA